MKKVYLNVTCVLTSFEENDVVTASLITEQDDGVGVSANQAWGSLFR